MSNTIKSYGRSDTEKKLVDQLGETAAVYDFNQDEKKSIVITARLSGRSLDVWEKLLDIADEASATQLIKEAIALRFLYESEKKRNRQILLELDEGTVPLSSVVKF